MDDEPSLKCARHNRARPKNTIGVPSNEQISSPVTSGDHTMKAVDIVSRLMC